MDATIELVGVEPQDMADFKARLQRSFTHGAQQAFSDWGETIPPERDINESLDAQGAEALWLVHAGARVGGAIVTGDGRDMHLDFIFVDPESQGLHLGLSAWRAIEARYPDAASWELVTPYHERRIIHFYVNLCGFSIVEYYNDRHPDPNFPEEEGGDYPGEDGGLFRFRKLVG